MPCVKHIVMWNLRHTNESERSAAIHKLKAAFEALKGVIPGLNYLEIGVDSSRIDYACDVVLYSEFESQQALDDYAVHPAHIQLKNELGDLRIARHQVDYVLNP